MNKKQIPKSVNFNGILDSIRLHILKPGISKFAVIYVFNLFEREIKIHFIVQKLNMKELNKSAYMILFWLRFITMYSTNKNFAQKIHLYVYFTDKQKMLPDDKYITIHKEHVNTGFAMTCTKNSEIIIYRTEEWFKVFIHETFHALGLDFACHKDIESANYILRLFKVKSKVNLYEAYTDTWAKIMNVAICSFFMDHDNNQKHFIDNFNVLMNLEMTFSIFQFVKILDFMGLTYSELISNDHLKLSLYKENTNILAYYIISSILLNNYEDFFVWCNIVNTNIFQFDNSKSLYSQIQFCKFIESKYQTRMFLKRVDSVMKIFDEVDDKYLLQNMRKSLCEMEFNLLNN